MAFQLSPGVNISEVIHSQHSLPQPTSYHMEAT